MRSVASHSVHKNGKKREAVKIFMGYKVCVYAICKNEEKFAARWVSSMKEADYIVVLDTGSEDNTVEILRNLGVRVEERIISPWRFDNARNASMELIPDDADICVCTDLDEFFESGWREKLENAWSDGVTQARYRYTWNFNDDGSEGYVFRIEKIHARHGFVWKHPVHEVLEYTGNEPENKISVPGMQLNHYADVTKSRSSYLPLLEMAVREDPDDDRNMHYLGREYMYYGMWDESIETLQKHIAMPRAVWADERCASMRYIARCYEQKGDFTSAKSWLYRAIAEAPYLREPYMDMAQLLYLSEEWDGIVYMCKCALAIKERTESYITEAQSWGAEPYDLASLGYFYTGRYGLSLEAARMAASLAPNDERILNNLAIIAAEVNKHNN